MATTVEQPEADGRSSKDLGRQLRSVRRKQGLSRAEVARSAGLTRRELAAYERGRIVIPESDLWCLAGSCGVDVNELLPDRTPLRIGSGLSSLAMGDSIRRLREPGQPEGLLREYLSMVYELRNLPPGSRIPLRESDLVILADALGGTPDVIEERLMELIGASHEEAARLRAMILPPLSLGSGLPSSTDPYAAYATPDAQSPVVDFFSQPRAQDPFSVQPPPVTMAPPSPTDAPVPDLPPPPLVIPDLQPPPGTTLGTDPIMQSPDPFAVAGTPPNAFADAGVNPFDPGTPFEAAPLDSTLASTPFDSTPFDAPSGFEPTASFDALADADAGADEDVDPFSMVMPTLRPDPFGLTPTTNGHDQLDGFVVDVPEGPLAEMSTSTDENMLSAPSTNGHHDSLALEVGHADSEPTDWAGIRDAAAVADAPPEVLLGDGWGAPAYDEPPVEEAVVDEPVYETSAYETSAYETSAYETRADETPGDSTVPDLHLTDVLNGHVPSNDLSGQELSGQDLSGQDLVEAPAADARIADLLLPESLEPEAFTLDATTLDALTPDALIPGLPHGTPALEDTRALEDTTDRYEVDLPTFVADPAPESAGVQAPIAWRAEHAAPTSELARAGTSDLEPKGTGQFEKAGTGWQVGGLFPATAMADDGALALRRADTRWALSDLDATGDFTIEVTLDYSAGTGFGLLFRASVDTHERITGYSFDVDPIAGGGGFLVRQWDDNRAHWRPIAQASMTDPADLYGRHTITLTVQGDRLGVFVDGENVLGVQALSRASIELGREPCRGGGLGVHAGATTELTVETFRAAQH